MDAVEKENLRLNRRIRRLESNMGQLEEMRETNARLMDQLLVGPGGGAAARILGSTSFRNGS
jgi:hypothetical protein